MPDPAAGKNGQIGHELQRSLPALGDLAAMGRADADFTDLAALEAAVAARRTRT